MKIVVSACLLGAKCKYNGGDNYNEAVAAFVQGHEVIRVCPERAAGMPSPRLCVECKNGILVDSEGRNVDAVYRQGVANTLKELEGQTIDLAILQPRSPTCGVRQVYDGTFSGKLIEGQGIFARALMEKGIRVVEPTDL